jgi:Uma2 family endonuclease
MEITSLSQLDLNGSYTYADYLLWKFTERVELLKGRIFKLAAPSRRHQTVAGNLHLQLGNALWKNPCKVYVAPFDVRLTKFSSAKNTEVTTVVQPDLCVICDPSKLDDKGCIGAPELVIEILSPENSRTELKEKFELYQDNGVLEYWIVNPTENVIQVWKLIEGAKLLTAAPFLEGDLITTPLIPHLELSVSDAFLD